MKTCIGAIFAIVSCGFAATSTSGFGMAIWAMTAGAWAIFAVRELNRSIHE